MKISGDILAKEKKRKKKETFKKSGIIQNVCTDPIDAVNINSKLKWKSKHLFLAKLCG